MEFQYVDSSSVEQFAYDADNQELHIIFIKGGYYIYSQVSPETAEEFATAPSKGQFVHYVLKKQGFPCRKA